MPVRRLDAVGAAVAETAVSRISRISGGRALAMPMTGEERLTLDLDGAVLQRYRTALSMTLAAVAVRGDQGTPAEPGADRAAGDWETDGCMRATLASAQGARAVRALP